MPDAREAAFHAYVDVLERLNADCLSELAALCDRDIRFTDPFKDTVGRGPYIDVLTRMFENLSEVTFEVRDRFMTPQSGYIRWDFRFRRAHGEPWLIAGMSEIHIGADNLVTRHIDHWDSGRQFYARLPVVGMFVRAIMRRI